jgi:ligand-binding sensor domain-containing protein
MTKNIQLKIFVIIVAALLVSISSYAQSNYHFKNFSDVEKLSNNQVTDFFQDSYGFMWIATDDGLNRYDGRSVKIYKNIQGDDESLPDNVLTIFHLKAHLQFIEQFWITREEYGLLQANLDL